MVVQVSMILELLPFEWDFSEEFAMDFDKMGYSGGPVLAYMASLKHVAKGASITGKIKELSPFNFHKI